MRSSDLEKLHVLWDMGTLCACACDIHAFKVERAIGVRRDWLPRWYWQVEDTMKRIGDR